ncbi:MAG: 3-oxoacyl-[acyl-carrier-protein] reductase [Eggerthellaceae bacterium]|jgi:3-oxoacyl-[acyl-carrier protein] reductase
MMVDEEQTETATGRVAVITGASRGIGAACARALAAQGCSCVLNFSSVGSEAAASELSDELEETYGVQTVIARADVSDYDQAKQLISGAKEAFGRVDVLVNNAGITRDDMLPRMREEEFDDVLRVNLKGAFNCMRHASRLMLRSHAGRIISIASVVGIRGNVGQANYAASKAGIIGLTKAAAKELAPRGITVNAVAPGFIATNMTDELDPEYRDKVRERIAMGEFGKPEDVANAVAFFASPESHYITGQVLAVDGGIVL